MKFRSARRGHTIRPALMVLSCLPVIAAGTGAALAGSRQAVIAPAAPSVPASAETPAGVPQAQANQAPANKAVPDGVFGDEGIPDTHASVRMILAAHPDQDLVLCLAGCGDLPSIVHIRANAPLAGPKQNAGAPAGSVQAAPTTRGPAIDQVRPESGDVICVAGCSGPAGGTVLHNARLTWLTGEAAESMKGVLREIAARIAQGGNVGTPPLARNFVSAFARAELGLAFDAADALRVMPSGQ